MTMLVWTPVTQCNKVVADIAAELLRKQRQRENTLATNEILDLCDQRRDLKRMRGELEGAQNYRDQWKIKENKMEKET